MGNIVAKLLTTAAVVAASFVAKKVTDGTWRLVTGRDPEDPEDPDVDVKEAIAFALLSGAVVGLARVLANRQAGKAIHRNVKED